MQPKVSVVIPVYNVEKYLAECLDSVLNQTLTYIEIICVEDCSTDNSAIILKEYSKIDARIKVIWHESNAGRSKARKDGVLAAQGRCIMFLDRDDALFPHACETAYTAIEKNKTDVMQFGAKVADNEGKTIHLEYLNLENCERMEDYNLLQLWRNGYCLNTLYSYEFEGAAGFARMQEIMKAFRTEKLDTIGGQKVEGLLDYKTGIDGLPKSDVLKFILEGHGSVVVRPSGTEPKLKTYIAVSAADEKTTKEVEKKIVEELKKRIADICE